MIAVANSTPLVHLSAMKKLQVLKDCYSEIFIPREVYIEVVEQGVGKPGEAEVKKANWIKTVSVDDRLAIQAFSTYLGLGESACIVLAMQIGVDLVIFDDRLARLEAEALNLKVVGTIGILMQAALKGMLDFPTSLKELIRTGFHLSLAESQRIMNIWKSQSQQ